MRVIKLFFRKLNFLLVVSAGLFTSFVAEALPKTVTSINLQASLDPKSEMALYRSVQKGLKKAQARVAKSKMLGHLHINHIPQQHYHITVGTFTAAHPNTPLTQTDSSVIWRQNGKSLTKNIGTYNKFGHIYGIHLYVHGFDKNGQSINYHYTSVADAKRNLRKDFDVKAGHSLKHFHIVGRYGTSPNGKVKGKFAKDCENIVAQLTKPGSKFTSATTHLGNNFLGHVTLAVMKRAPGKVTAQSQSFGMKFYNQIIGMYEDVAKDFQRNTQNHNKQLRVMISKFNTSTR